MRELTNYGVLRQAVDEMKQVRCVYHGLYRELCIHIIGQRKDGTDGVLAFQFAGKTSKGTLPPEGEWRCLEVSKIEQIELRDGPWHTSDRHTRPQTCIKVIDTEVKKK